jgi:hypothetical protein
LSPPIYLILLMVILLAAVTADAVVRFVRRRKLRAAAHQWGMHFAPGDRLRLARRIVGQFPVPGAANISVRDLLFRTEDNRHQYVFTVDYTVGAIRGKVGRSCVAGFSEPVSRGGRPSSASPALTLATGHHLGPGAYEEVVKKVQTESAG